MGTVLRIIQKVHLTFLNCFQKTESWRIASSTMEATNVCIQWLWTKQSRAHSILLLCWQWRVQRQNEKGGQAARCGFHAGALAAARKTWTETENITVFAMNFIGGPMAERRHGVSTNETWKGRKCTGGLGARPSSSVGPRQPSSSATIATTMKQPLLEDDD